MLRSLALEGTVSCARCRARTSLSRLASTVVCAACEADVEVDWSLAFVVSHRGEAVSVLDLLPACAEGESFPGAGAWLSRRVTVAWPRCACGSALDEAAVAKIDFRTRLLACPACASEIPARLVRGGAPEAVRYALGESSDAVAIGGGRVVRCGSCGAPASTASGGAPAGPCAFCGATTVAPADEALGLGRPFFLVVRV